MMKLWHIWLTVLVYLAQVLATIDTSQYNWSPTSRDVLPVAIHSTIGIVSNDGPVLGFDDVTNAHSICPNSSITYDFGHMTAGFLRLNIGSASESGKLFVAYSESPTFIGNKSDNSVFYSLSDGVIALDVQSAAVIELDSGHGRGSFRYVTLSTDSGYVQILGISNRFSAMPTTVESRLRDYSGYFASSDDLLNRIWYAGAYTNQMCLVAANSSIDHATYISNGGGWGNNASVANLAPIDVFLADGAKRDRNPWAGDLSIAISSVAVSQNHDNLIGIANALRGMLALQDNVTGYFPYAGSPLGIFLGSSSDTYHMWTMAGFADYVARSGDVKFAYTQMKQIVRGIEAVRIQIDPVTGLFNGSRKNDWGRLGLSGSAIATNAILYHTLQSLIALQGLLNHPDLNATYTSLLQQTAERIKLSVNLNLFDTEAGLYWDNTTSAGHQLYPQDGNSYAVRYNLTSSMSQAQQISQGLAARLGIYGAPAPELPTAISPYISGHEIEAHFLANPVNSSRAMELIRRQWGFMQNFSTSTHIEGYSTDGSLNYAFYPDPSFISHAHAWSTGPTASLMTHILGLSPVTRTSSWSFAPHFIGSGVQSCSGGFVSGNDSYDAVWRVEVDGTFIAQLSILAQSPGMIKLPVSTGSRLPDLFLNGRLQNVTSIANCWIEVANVAPGNHSICLRGARSISSLQREETARDS